MYGMVNRAIKDYLIAHYGTTTWQRVQVTSNATEDDFLSMEQYPDELTVSLIHQAVPETGKSVDQLLEEVGIHWIEFALKSDYGPLLRAAGTSLREVLENLDCLHSRLVNAFPELTPPSFWCSDVELTQEKKQPGYTNALVLHYLSERAGLSTFVVGLVRGLAQMLDVDCQVTLISEKTKGADHDSFLVEYTPRIAT